MKVNYSRKTTGKRTTIVIPDYLCQLWFMTTPSSLFTGDSANLRKRLKEHLERLGDPQEGETFQHLAEFSMMADITGYQTRLLMTNEEMKVRIIEALLSWLQGAIKPNDSAADVFKAIEGFKNVPWEIAESFESLEEQR